MTKSVAETFIEKKDLDLVDLAKRFVKSYYEEPHRGYGQGVVTVCDKFNQVNSQLIILFRSMVT